MPRTAKITDNPKKSTPLADVSAEAKGAKAKGASNEPDRDEFLFLVGQLDHVDDEMKKAKDARKRMRNQAKLRGIDLEQCDFARKERDLEDGTTLDNLRTRKKYFEFLGLPIGSQMQLFDSPNGGVVSQQSVNEKAYSQGYELGVMARNPDEQAYPPMTPEGMEHLRGWNDGQAVNLKKLEKLSVEFAAEDAAKKAKSAKKSEGDETKH